MKKLRVSYSLLSAFESGRKDAAVGMFLHKPSPVTPAMEAGLSYHQTWEKLISSTGSLPWYFGQTKLSTPRCEEKIEKDVSDTVQLVGVVDLYDAPTIYEFKTGRRSASSYAFNSKQHLVYHLLLDGEPTKAIYMHYDQYSKSADAAIIHLSPDMLETTRSWVLDTANKFQKYLIEQGVPLG